MGGYFESEQVATFNRNRWLLWSGFSKGNDFVKALNFKMLDKTDENIVLKMREKDRQQVDEIVHQKPSVLDKVVDSFVRFFSSTSKEDQIKDHEWSVDTSFKDLNPRTREILENKYGERAEAKYQEYATRARLNKILEGLMNKYPSALKNMAESLNKELQ